MGDEEVHFMVSKPSGHRRNSSEGSSIARYLQIIFLYGLLQPFLWGANANLDLHVEKLQWLVIVSYQDIFKEAQGWLHTIKVFLDISKASSRHITQVLFSFRF